MAIPSKKVIQKLRLVAAQIQQEPELYDQSDFLGFGDSPCNTACCIGGWLVWNESPSKFKSCVESYDDAKVFVLAKQIIGVENPNLFQEIHKWPSPFSKNYKAAEDSRQRAAVAAARIEHYIATGE